MATLDQLMNTRRALKGHLTRWIGEVNNKLTTPVSDSSDAELDIVMLVLEKKWTKFE